MNVLSRVRVLVLDNDPRVGDHLRAMLDPDIYDVAIVPGVGQSLLKQAVAVACDFRPHAAIVDLRLQDDDAAGDRSGLDLLENLRSARCILYSAYLAPDVTREAAQKYGANWIGKSESPQRLLDAIADAAREKCAAYRGFSISPSAWTSQRIVQTLFGKDTQVPPRMVEDILSQLFPKSKKVALETMEGAVTTPRSVGRGRSVILKAWRDDKKEPLVLKLAPAERIMVECQNYSKYIDGNLGGRFNAILEVGPVAFWDLGGVLYSFVGAPRIGLPSFAAFYGKQQEPQAILRPLQHFFTEVWGALYRDATRLVKGLFEAYDDLLRLGKRLQDFPNREEYMVFPDIPTPLPNPVVWVLRHKDDSATIQGYQAIIHGDLHGDNLFVDESHAWAIDFERSGHGPILLDFVEPEVDIVTRFVSFPENDLSQFYELAIVLAEPAEPAAPLKSTTRLQKDAETSKALEVVAGLRQMAHEVTRYTDSREYLWGLIFDALFVASLVSEDNPQRKRALLLSSVLCGRLRQWGKEWPPADWPQVEWVEIPQSSTIAQDRTSKKVTRDLSKTRDTTQVDRPRLRRLIIERFGDNELRTLCFDLGVDYESLPGEGKVDKARELVAQLDREGRLSELVEACRRLRPNVDW